MEVTNVAVIGGGTMGNGIAHVFAMSGLPVHLVETTPELAETALGTIDKNLGRMVKKDKISEDDKEKAVVHIDAYTDVRERVPELDLVLYAIRDIMKIKKKVFATIDQSALEKAVLASNTSSISITNLAAATARPNRFIDMDFSNPVLM